MPTQKEVPVANDRQEVGKNKITEKNKRDGGGVKQTIGHSHNQLTERCVFYLKSRAHAQKVIQIKSGKYKHILLKNIEDPMVVN